MAEQVRPARASARRARRAVPAPSRAAAGLSERASALGCAAARRAAPQDWNPVTFSKRPNKPPSSGGAQKQEFNKALRDGGVIESTKKYDGGKNKAVVGGAGANAAKLDAETEELKHNRVDLNLSKSIMQARTAKKMTQDQLAKALNIVRACGARAGPGAAARCRAPRAAPHRSVALPLALAAHRVAPQDKKIIMEYENGKAIPNGQVIAKIERALGAKLPRPPKK